MPTSSASFRNDDPPETCNDPCRPPPPSHLVRAGRRRIARSGHTDSTGAPDYNQKLSEARAQAVAAPLIAGGMQFAPGQIIGRGETMPLSPNDTPEGRQDNRRVVIIVTP